MDLMNQTSGAQPQDSIVTQPKKGPSSRKFWLLGGAFVLLLVIATVVYTLTLDSLTTDEQTHTATVNITSEGFEPATIKIKKGQSITWVKQDGDAHELGADEPNPTALNSEELLEQNDTYTVTFEEPGTFHYHDTADPVNKQGTIIIE